MSLDREAIERDAKQKIYKITKISGDIIVQQQQKIIENEKSLIRKDIDLKNEQTKVNFLSDKVSKLNNELESYKKKITDDEDIIDKTCNEAIDIILTKIEDITEELEKERREYTLSSGEILSNWINSWKI